MESVSIEIADRAMELTILMPCLNEARTLGNCIDRALTYLSGAQVAGEVLVADNGSTDGSQAIALARGARVITASARGYCAALIAGISAAHGRFVVMGDSDESYAFSDLDGSTGTIRPRVKFAQRASNRREQFQNKFP